jgi:alcohol dehydrogenase class IV
MLNFEFHNPVHLLVGRGKVALAGETVAKYGKRAIIVTSGSSGRTGLLKRVTAALAAQGVTYVVFDKVQQNPLTTMVVKGAELARQEKCDVVLGLGGGSSMDAAKAIALLSVNGGDINEYVFGKPASGALPLVLITTTAGTGSEGNCIAVLTNPDNNDKKGMKSPYIYAKASIVDPELMMTLPARTIASTGMDAMFHAVEAYVSVKNNPIADAISLQAVNLLYNYLPKVYKDPQDTASWEQVALANTLAGMAIDAAGTTLPHGMEHPLSGLYNVVHGQGLAALFLEIMEFNYRTVPQRYADIAKIMGRNVEALSIEAAAQESIEGMRELLTSVDLILTLTDLGVQRKDVDWLTDNAFKTMKAAIGNNPRPVTPDDVKAIYTKCI